MKQTEEELEKRSRGKGEAQGRRKQTEENQ